MPNEVEILIKATAAGNGPAETSAGLEKVTASAQQAAAATRELTAAEKEQVAANVQAAPQRGLDVEQLAARREMARLEAEAGGEEEARNASVLRQRQMIVDLDMERLHLSAAGNAEEAEAQAQIVAARKMSLALQQQLGMSEDEATALAETRVELETQITRQKAEQEGIQLRGLGTGGRMAGMLLGGEIGFAVTMGLMLLSVMGQWGDSAEKTEQEIHKIGDEWEKDKSKIEGYETSAKKLPASANAYEKALKAVNKALDEAEKSIGRQLAAQEKLAAANEKLAIAKIKDDATLTPEQKDAKIADAEKAYDDKKAAIQEKADADKIDIEQKKIDAAQAAAASARQHADEEDKARAAAAAQVEKRGLAIKGLKEVMAEQPGGAKGKKGLVQEGGEFSMAALGDIGVELTNYFTGRHTQAPTDEFIAGRARRKELAAQIPELERKQKADEKKAAALKKQADDAERAAQRLADQAKQTEATSGSTIADLKTDLVTTGSVAVIQDQTAALDAKARDNEAKKKEAAEAERLRKEQARLDKEREKMGQGGVDKEVGGIANSGPFFNAEIQHRVDAAEKQLASAQQGGDRGQVHAALERLLSLLEQSQNSALAGTGDAGLLASIVSRIQGAEAKQKQIDAAMKRLADQITHNRQQ